MDYIKLFYQTYGYYPETQQELNDFIRDYQRHSLKQTGNNPLKGVLILLLLLGSIFYFILSGMLREFLLNIPDIPNIVPTSTLTVVDDTNPVQIVTATPMAMPTNDFPTIPTPVMSTIPTFLPPTPILTGCGIDQSCVPTPIPHTPAQNTHNQLDGNLQPIGGG